MTELLDELTELDRRHREGGLSEHAYRRARERLVEEHALTGGHEPAHGLRDRERGKKNRQPPPDRTGVDRTGKKRPDEGDASRAPRQRDRSAPAVQRRGSPALEALLLLIVGVAFSEAVAQTAVDLSIGIGLPFYRIDGQYIFLPGPGLYALRALEAGGTLDVQQLLAVLLTPCYLAIPWGAYRSLKTPGGIGQMFAGYAIAFRYILVAAIVAFVYLAVFENFPIDVYQHVAIPGLIGVAILGTVLAVVILLRRLVSR